MTANLSRLVCFLMLLHLCACGRVGALNSAPGAVPLVKADETPNFGVWTGEISSTDPRNYDQGILLNAIQGAREKSWQYMGIYTEQAIIGLAVVNVGYIGTMFAYIYDRETKELWQTEVEPPLAAGVRVDRNVALGYSTFDGGDQQLRIVNDIHAGYRHIYLKLEKDGKPFELSVRIDDDFEQVVPLQVVRPTPSGTFSFTHKAAGLPVSGMAKVGERAFTFNPKKDFAAVDYTFGFPAYHTVWNWASMAGYASDGTLIGLNLVDPIQDKTINENGLWVNGDLIQLGKANYTFDKNDTMKPWTIRTEDGHVDLVFTPLGKRAKEIDMGLLASVFEQPFGYFSGTVRDRSGKVYELQKVPGVVEDHEARW